MIALSDQEKDFLKSVVDLSNQTHNMFLGNLVDHYLRDIDVFLDYNNQNVEYRFDQNVFPTTTDFFDLVREMSWTFMKFVKLLKYLEEKNFLYLYQESPLQNTSRFGQLVVGNPFFTSSLHDPEIKRLLLDCSHRTIIVGQPLIDYVKNDFKSVEELRHNENVKIAQDALDKSIIGLEQSEKSIGRATTAIIISIILGLISIGASFYIASQQAKNETKMNKEQFDELNAQFRSLNNRVVLIDSALQEIIIPDTINAVIVNGKK